MFADFGKGSFPVFGNRLIRIDRVILFHSLFDYLDEFVNLKGLRGNSENRAVFAGEDIASIDSVDEGDVLDFDFFDSDEPSNEDRVSFDGLELHGEKIKEHQTHSSGKVTDNEKGNDGRMFDV